MKLLTALLLACACGTLHAQTSEGTLSDIDHYEFTYQEIGPGLTDCGSVLVQRPDGTWHPCNDAALTATEATLVASAVTPTPYVTYVTGDFPVVITGKASAVIQDGNVVVVRLSEEEKQQIADADEKVKAATEERDTLRRNIASAHKPDNWYTMSSMELHIGTSEDWSFDGFVILRQIVSGPVYAIAPVDNIVPSAN